jgi:hypothetical protein
MKMLSVVLVLCASASAAMDNNVFIEPPTSPYLYDRVEIFEDPEPQDGWYARAVVRNVRGSYNETETESTSLGSVGVEYKTTKPSLVNDPDSADSACVVFLPEGVVAIPECVTILEEDSKTIYLYKYNGS